MGIIGVKGLNRYLGQTVRHNREGEGFSYQGRLTREQGEIFFVEPLGLQGITRDIVPENKTDRTLRDRDMLCITRPGEKLLSVRVKL